MTYKINGKLKRLTVNMRFVIVSIFILLFTFGMLLVIGLTYHRMSKNIMLTSSTFMKKTSTIVDNEMINNQMHSVELLSKNLAQLITLGILDMNNRSQYEPYIKMLIKLYTLPILQGIGWGDEHGNCYIAGKQPNSDIITETICHPGSYATTYIQQPGKPLKTYTQKNVFDPRKRPWYVATKNSKQFGWTKPFIYALPVNEDILGLCAATPVYHTNGALKGVITIAIRKDFLNKFLNQVYVSEHATINIVTYDGKLIATSDKATQKIINNKLVDIHALSIPGLVESFNHYLKKEKMDFTFQENGYSYIANYRPTSRWLIVIVAPESDFNGKIRKANIMTLGVGLIILILGIAIILKVVKLILKPMKSLITEIEEIKQLKLERRQPIQSRINEIANIADAIERMKNGLRSFKKYIPEPLARQLIENGQDAKIGGKKQQLAIMFSDIANFTAISEDISPDKLMQHLCVYFDELTHIILARKGTIDKYIGDSVMAFWGAPLVVEHPCHQAAKAALNCKRRLAKLNLKWESENKPILFTRFGIHYDAAIVGNLGSKKHLSYTAIGDPVNIASRLQSINKHYGTEIIVSEAVYRKIKNQYILRMIDHVVLKGRTKPTIIYELIEEKNKPIPFDIVNYSTAFELGFNAYKKMNWDNAVNFFLQ